MKEKEGAHRKELPPKPPEHIDEVVVHNVASSQLAKGEVDKEGYATNNMLVDDASLSSTNSYDSQTIDKWPEKELTDFLLACDLGEYTNNVLRAYYCKDNEVDKEDHATNDMFVHDTSISSTGSYNSQMTDNCSKEDLFLAIDFGKFTNDELVKEFCKNLVMLI
jgi:hypothetical protein